MVKVQPLQAAGSAGNDNETDLLYPADEMDAVDLMFLAEAEGDHNIAFGFFGFDPYGGLEPADLSVATRGEDGHAIRVPAHYELEWPTDGDADSEDIQYAEGPPKRVLVAGHFEPAPISINFPERGDVSHVFALEPVPEHPERDAAGQYLDLYGDPMRAGIDLSVYPDLVVDRTIRRFRRPSTELLDIDWDDGTRSRVPALYELIHPIHNYEACDEDGEGEASGPPYWRLWPVPDERYRFRLDTATGIYSGLRKRTMPVAVSTG